LVNSQYAKTTIQACRSVSESPAVANAVQTLIDAGKLAKKHLPGAVEKAIDKKLTAACTFAETATVDSAIDAIDLTINENIAVVRGKATNISNDAIAAISGANGVVQAQIGKAEAQFQHASTELVAEAKELGGKIARKADDTVNHNEHLTRAMDTFELAVDTAVDFILPEQYANKAHMHTDAGHSSERTSGNASRNKSPPPLSSEATPSPRSVVASTPTQKILRLSHKIFTRVSHRVAPLLVWIMTILRMVGSWLLAWSTQTLGKLATGSYTLAVDTAEKFVDNDSGKVYSARLVPKIAHYTMPLVPVLVTALSLLATKVMGVEELKVAEMKHRVQNHRLWIKIAAAAAKLPPSADCNEPTERNSKSKPE
jgi:hypothetical protein